MTKRKNNEDYAHEDEPKNIRHDRGDILKNITKIISVILLLLVALVIYAAVDATSDVFNGIKSIFSPPPPTYNTISTALVLEGVQSLSQLTTTRYTFSDVLMTERELPGLLRALYKDKYIIGVVGYVVGGIELGQLTEEDIRIEDGVVVITLPEPQLQDCFLDEEASQVIDRDRGLFTAYDPRLVEHGRKYAIVNFRDRAVEQGILTDINEKAVEVVEAFTGLLVRDDQSIISITVEATSPNADLALPPSCIIE